MVKISAEYRAFNCQLLDHDISGRREAKGAAYTELLFPAYSHKQTALACVLQLSVLGNSTPPQRDVLRHLEHSLKTVLP